MILILVPARGESKGIPGKNLAKVGGIPLVARAVRTGRLTLQSIGEQGLVVCSTESKEIAAVAREWGAEVPFVRPTTLASDQARQIDVVVHAIEALSMADDVTVVLLQPTSPFTAVDDVLATIERHRQCGQPVVTVTTVDHPLEWTLKQLPNGVLEAAVQGEVPATRQDRYPLVKLNGAVYAASAGRLKRQESFLGPSTQGLLMPKDRSIDIDAPSDLDRAEYLANSRAVAPIDVSGRKIGAGNPCFIIAEAGVNHNGSVELALDLVDVAAEAGADAVKFQTFHTERVVSEQARQANYQRSNTGIDEPQYEMICRLQLDDSAFAAISMHCHERGIMFLSSPFDTESVDLLDSLGVPAFKVGSGELTHPALLTHIASKGKPVLLSTGMASLLEVSNALDVITFSGAPPVALLHCVSNYPTDPIDCNLEATRTMRAAFAVPVGWSDHTLGIHVSLAAVALGAELIEKHFTLDRTLPGPDHRASLEPDELRDLVRQIRDVENALGDGEKTPRDSERNTADVARRSLHASRDIHAGHRIAADDLTALRPGTGIPADRFDEIVGRHALNRVPAGAMIRESDLE